VSFTVGTTGAAAPSQLPRTGDASDLTPLLFGMGVVGLVLGIALRGLALRFGHRG
jgi:LPXTG-motif cell wall-anchored protein